MPAYNEERYIGTMVLKARKHADKVIVIDDGSTDNTAEIAGLAGAIVLRHPRNKGKGAAIRSILTEVKKRVPDVLVLLDADYQHNPDEMPRMIKAVLDGYDFVIGSREFAKSGIPFYRRIGQKALLYSTRILTRNRITDSESGFKALSRKAILKLDLTQIGFAIESEMLVVSEEKKLKITEVPISVIYTRDGSTINPVRQGLEVLTQIIVMISERRPLFFFGLLGSILSITGFIAGIRTLQVLMNSGVLAVGTTMLSVLLLIVGMFCIFTGIILHTLTKRIN